jgi:hypothetical protein
LFEPDENITEDEINVVCNSVAVILPATFKLLLMVALPVTIKNSFIVTPLLISKPLFGESMACAEPDFILSISPIAEAGIFTIPLPSPLKKDAEMDPEILSPPVICVFALITSGELPGESIVLTSIIEAEKAAPLTTLIDFGEALITGLPLT